MSITIEDVKKAISEANLVTNLIAKNRIKLNPDRIANIQSAFITLKQVAEGSDVAMVQIATEKHNELLDALISKPEYAKTCSEGGFDLSSITRIAATNAAVRQLQEENAKLQAEVAELTKKLQAADTALEERNKDLADKNSFAFQLTQEKDELAQKLAAAQKEATESKQLADANDEAIKKVIAHSEEQQKEIDALNADVAAKNTAITDLTKQLAQAKAELDVANLDKEAAEKEVANLKTNVIYPGQLTAAQEAKAKAEQDVLEAQGKIKSLEENLEVINQTVAKLNDDIDDLNNQLEVFKESNGRLELELANVSKVSSKLVSMVTPAAVSAAVVPVSATPAPTTPAPVVPTVSSPVVVPVSATADPEVLNLAANASAIIAPQPVSPTAPAVTSPASNAAAMVFSFQAAGQQSAANSPASSPRSSTHSASAAQPAGDASVVVAEPTAAVQELIPVYSVSIDPIKMPFGKTKEVKTVHTDTVLEITRQELDTNPSKYQPLTSAQMDAWLSSSATRLSM